MVRLNPEDLAKRVEGLDWRLEGEELVKVVRKQDFAAALAYLNRVGQLAESVGHHPDMELRWNVVTLRLYTHSIGGVTGYDIDLAHLIDELDEAETP
jgi:4a-hydroxytetrahydrobiopterin dehydratase